MIELLNVSGLAPLVWKEQLACRALAFFTSAAMFTKVAGPHEALDDAIDNRRMRQIEEESAYRAVLDMAKGLTYFGWSMEDYP